ncbi:MAG: hypothetical protein GKR91_08570 [Pseudomonadales bacterium]|nr:hypothetical protein [Pseudomonadales bacterium]
MMNKQFILSVLFVSAFGIFNFSFAQNETLLDKLEYFPDDATRSHYLQRSDDIEQLLNSLNPENNLEERIESFRVLISGFPLAAEFAAREYVTDESEEIALGSVRLLENALVMSDHSVSGSSSNSRMDFFHAKNEANVSALRLALTDDRASIRTSASQFLASISDRVSLDIISESTEEGVYDEGMAANLYSLAESYIGNEYLQEFLGNGDLIAQETAINYLGIFEEYQDQIRQSYFFNPDAESSLRRSAATVLSNFDSNFADYALLITTEENLDPEVFSTSISGYVNSLDDLNLLDRFSAESILSRIEQISTANPMFDNISNVAGSELESLGQRLESVVENR